MSNLRLHRSIALCLCLLACGGGGGSEPSAATPAASSSGAEQSAAEPVAPEPAPAAAEPQSLDPVTVSPDVFKVLLDGPRARVLEATWQPGQKDNPHGHPPLVAYAVTPIFGLAYAADESSLSIRLPQGRVMQQSAVDAHAFQNRSKEVAKMILVEHKSGHKPGKAPPDGAPDAMLAAPEIFELMAFDAGSRVLLGTWKPGQKDKLHSHPALTIYAITDVEGKLTNDKGQSESLVLKAGTAQFIEPVKAHSFENTGSATAQLLIVEQRK